MQVDSMVRAQYQLIPGDVLRDAHLSAHQVQAAARRRCLPGSEAHPSRVRRRTRRVLPASSGMQPDTRRLVIGELNASCFKRFAKVFQCAVVRRSGAAFKVRDGFRRDFACIGELLLRPIQKRSCCATLHRQE